MAAVLHELDGTNGDEDALELGGDTANCCDDLESDEAEEVQRRRELGQGDVDYGGELEAERVLRKSMDDGEKQSRSRRRRLAKHDGVGDS